MSETKHNFFELAEDFRQALNRLNSELGKPPIPQAPSLRLELHQEKPSPTCQAKGK